MFALAAHVYPTASARPALRGTVDPTRRAIRGRPWALTFEAASLFGLMAISLSVTFVAPAPVRGVAWEKESFRLPASCFASR